MDPKGHAAIVTGGASGLGAETAATSPSAGVKVALPRHQSRRRDATAGKIGGIAVRCDVTSSDSAAAALEEARDKHGPARILINCAGIGPAKRMVGRDGPMPLADFEKVIAINLTGTFNMMRLAAADMQSSSRSPTASAASSSRPPRSRRSKARSARPPMPPRRAASPR